MAVVVGWSTPWLALKRGRWEGLVWDSSTEDQRAGWEARGAKKKRALVEVEENEPEERWDLWRLSEENVWGGGEGSGWGEDEESVDADEESG